MKQTMGKEAGLRVGGLGKDLCYAMISTYLTIYLTDTVGLAPLFGGQPVPGGPCMGRGE